MTLPIAGWYDDPNDGSQLRWWDGSVWAKPTRPKQATIPPGWYEDPASPGTTTWWDGSAWGEPPAEAVGVPARVGRPGDVPMVESGARQPSNPPAALFPEPNLPTAPETALPVDGEPVPEGVMTVGTHTAVTESSAAAPEAAPVAPAELLAVADVDDAVLPNRSRSRWLLVVAAVVAIALVVGLAWLVRGRLQESHLADPPSTSAEKDWGIAGDSLGSSLGARGITSAQLSTVCAGGFQDLWEGPLPTAVQGVDENRARKIYVDACVAGFSHPAGPPSTPATGAATKPAASPSPS